jgi:restriction system protein
MAEVTRKRTGELLRKLFEILQKHPEGLTARDALKQLAAAVEMTPHEKGLYPAGGRRFETIVRYGTIDCVKAGWLVKQNGVWIVTDEGVSAYKKLADPEIFYKRAVQLYREWKASKQGVSKDATTDSSEEADAEKAASITYEEAQDLAWNEIDQALAGMNPYEFQQLVADLIVAMGYFVSWVSPRGKDGGVDIIAHPDALGMSLPRIKVQVKKRISEKVDVEVLRSFLAIIGDNDAGIFVSIAGFTGDAATLARSQENRTITLIDARQLVGLWIKFYDKLDSKARARLQLTPIYFLTPET